MDGLGERSPGERNGGASQALSRAGELDLAALGRALWAKRLWIAAPTALALAGSLVAVNLTPPTYRSEARILVESAENPYTRPETERGSAPERQAVDQEAVASQVQVLMSREIARGVAGDLGLARRPEFEPALRGFNPVKKLLMVAGLADDPLRMTQEERILRHYYERLTAYQVDKSRVIAVQFDSSDPALAAEAANAVANRFIEAQQANKRAQTRVATRWLAGEIDGLRRKVEEAEGRVESFRARSNLFVGANNTSLTAQQLAEINSQIAAARAQQADAQTRARLLRDFLRTGRPIESGDVANSEIIRRLNEQRATVQAQLAEQGSTLGPRHPRIQELRSQFQNLEAQMRVEAEKLVRILENDARLAGARVEQLSQNLDQAKRQATEASEQEVQLRVLEREAKSHRDQLEALLARYRDATARDNLTALPADARIISRATVSNVPAFPKKLPTILIVTLGTFVLAAGCIAAGALMGGLAGGEAEREGAASAPLLGEAPPLSPESQAVLDHLAFDEDRVRDLDAPEGAPAASIRELAALLPDRAGRVLVVATDAGLAATGVTVALGRHLAQRQDRVVMIDLDARNAALSAFAGAGTFGLGDFIAGRAGLAEIIHRDPLSRAHFVPIGRRRGERVEDPSTHERLAFAVGVLSRGYDRVLILAGEAGGEGFPALSGLADHAVVVASGAEEAVTAALSRLTEAGLGASLMMAVEEAAAA